MQNTHPRRNQDSCTGSCHQCLYTLRSSPFKEFMKVHADTLKTGRKGGFFVYFTQRTIYARVKYTRSLLSELGICCMCFLRMYDR